MRPRGRSSGCLGLSAHTAVLGSGALFPVDLEQTHANGYNRARGGVHSAPTPALGPGLGTREDGSDRPHSRVLRSWPIPLPGSPMH